MQTWWTRLVNRLTYLASYRTTRVLAMTLLALMLPSVALANAENPVTRLRDKMKLRWEILDNSDFVFIIIMIGITIMIIGAFIFIIGRIVAHVIKSQRGKAVLWDKQFWLTQGGALVILFFFTGGFLFTLLEKLYDWTHGINLDK